jgi:aerobic carbon-monoxide dehydrogenase small subunit
MTAITLTVNGKPVGAEVTPRTHLADFLRETLLLTGTHIGCEHGICGACTVEINGEIARACITYAVACDGAAVRTIEGFADDASMAALRSAFRQHHALQCGYCTPGMLIAARDLVRRKGGLGRDQIRREMSGNLCRCTGYMGIIDAIAEVMATRPAAPANNLRPAATVWLGPAPGPGAAGSAPASDDVAAKATARDAAAGGTAWSAGGAARANLSPARAITVTMARLEERDGRTWLSQQFMLDHPPAAVWALLSDIETLARCLPGLRLEGPPRGNRVAGHLDLKLGPITARFAGEGRLRLSPAEQRLDVEGRGVDRKGGSNVTGSLACWIAPAATAQTATTVHLDLAYALTGPLAQIGRGGIVRDLARRLGEMFAQNMDRHLSDPGGAMPAPPVAGFAILRQIILGRLAGLFDRLRGRPRA